MDCQILVIEEVTMHDVENVLEGVLCLLSRQSELVEQLRLNYCVWLGDNKIVSVRILIKCKLQKVLGSRVESCLHAEESNCEGILESVRRLRYRSQIVDLLNDALDSRVR